MHRLVVRCVPMPNTPPDLIDTFIARWDGTERAERANYVSEVVPGNWTGG